MGKLGKLWRIGLVLLCLVACNHKVVHQDDTMTNEDRTADALFEDYFEDYLKLYPSVATTVGDHRYDDRLEIDISEEHREHQANLHRTYLDGLGQLNREELSNDRRLSYDVLQNQLQNAQALLEYPAHLMPVHFMNCLPNEFAYLGSGKGEHPFATPDDYENFLSRIGDFVRWIDTAISNMRKGMQNGYVPPKIVIQRTIKLVERQLVADLDESTFVAPLKLLSDLLPKTEAADLERRYRETLRDDLLPAYRKLVTFMQEEYLPEGRDTVAWSALPDGKAWYRQLVKSYTTTEQSPKQIHQLGLQEVARLSPLYRDARELAEDKQTLPRYTDKMELLRAYKQIVVRVEPGLEKLFGFQPRTPFGISSSNGGAYYRPGSEDGSRAGVFFVGIGDLGKRARAC